MNRLVRCVILVFLFAGAYLSANDELHLTIIDRHVDWGHGKPSSPRTIDTVVIHSTYSVKGSPYDLNEILRQFKDYGVSSHYLISRVGNVFRLVKDEHIAYHAGQGTMPDGRTGINNFSIGIEINNTVTEGPTDLQYEALKRLVLHLRNTYSIFYIVGHGDVTDRKTDPWKFDRKRFNRMTGGGKEPISIRQRSCGIWDCDVVE